MAEPADAPAPKASANPAVEKLERDVLRLIDALNEMGKSGEKQTLRAIAERSGLSKDEVNRYLNPQVNEVYNYERLVGVRGRNRPLYNHLIVSGPPHVVEAKWAGINANTSKYALFKAVAQRYGYEVRYLGATGQIIDLEYRGIEATSLDRLGKVFSTQEPVMHL
ncbi:MAG TPA: hypothetical protein VNX21_07530 [Candidatus Thermoplasmatota archaeon]|nr:hypothetical protein [Candidatus Thermoplasmatota archaeon]